MNDEITLLERRTYKLAEGTLARYEIRLRNVTAPIYKRIGLRFDGFWVSEEDPTATYYTLQWKSREEMEQGWKTLLADPEYLASREGYESPVVEYSVELLSRIA